MSHTDEKIEEARLEESIHEIEKDNVDRHLAVQLPEVLQGLSKEEIIAIDNAATKKLDILLMPILVVLYILYVPRDCAD